MEWLGLIGPMVTLGILWMVVRHMTRPDAPAPPQVIRTEPLNARDFLLAQVAEPVSPQQRRRAAAEESARIARGDWTKDVPGDYSPLPPETAEQLVARLDRASVRDWERQWEALAGYPWRRHDAVTHQKQITMWESERQTRMLAAMHKNQTGTQPNTLEP